MGGSRAVSLRRGFESGVYGIESGPLSDRAEFLSERLGSYGELLHSVRSFLARRVRPPEDLDDVVQETALRLLRAMPSYRGDASLRTFAHSIAWRTLTDRRRTASRKAASSDQATCEGVGVDPFQEARRRSPHNEYLRMRRGRALARLLDCLSELQAETLVLRYVEGNSVREIARKMDAPIDTVKSRLRFAVSRLRDAIRRDEVLQELLELRD